MHRKLSIAQVNSASFARLCNIAKASLQAEAEMKGSHIYMFNEVRTDEWYYIEAIRNEGHFKYTLTH